jgi:hypothetical protein
VVSNRPHPHGQSVFRLRIQLQGVDPIVWRRVLVPGSVRLSKLSDMLLATMGWADSHLHSFRIGDKLFGMHFEDWAEDEIDEKSVTVLQSLGDEHRFFYDYDFGDSWEHEVVVEELTWTDIGLKFAVCLDGENACPPEDVGGTHGYSYFLEAIADPGHDEHDSYLDWVGGSFDPMEFDLAGVNALCQKVR